MQQTTKRIRPDGALLLRTPQAVGRVITSGDARITLYNRESGVRATWHVKVTTRQNGKGWVKNHGIGPWLVFLPVVTGAEAFIGYIRLSPFSGKLQFLNEAFRNRENKKALTPVLAMDSPRVRGIRWVVQGAESAERWPDRAVFWQSSSCARCGKKLHSEWRLIGYGEVCCAHLHISDKLIFGVLSTEDTNAQIVKARHVLHGEATPQTKRLLRDILPAGIVKDYARQSLPLERGTA